MARHAGPDHAGNGRVSAKEHGLRLSRHRPHGRLAAHRSSLRYHDVAPSATLRPQALPARRRRNGHDRRPVGQEPGAQPARFGHAVSQPGGHQEAGFEVSRLRRSRAQQGRTRQQLRLDEGLHLPRLRARGGEAHHRQLHDGQGQREEAPQRRSQRRTVVHRIYLSAAPGLRLPVSVREARRASAAGRKRPVGQHDDRNGTHPPHAGQRSRSFLPHLPAHHQGRRQEVRQDRERKHLARPQPHHAIRLLSVLAQRE